MTFKSIFIILIAATMTGCLTTYPVVKESKSAAFIKFERNIEDPLLGSITRYVKVDKKQECRQGYSEHKLLAVQNKGNPLVSDLNLNGLYVNPGDFRILINTVAGGAWCGVFVGVDIKADQKYKIVANGDLYIGVNKCSAKIYQLAKDNTYQELKPKEYYECNK